MAVAVAAGLAVSGVQVVDTTAPFGAPAAFAQAADSIPSDAITVEGLFDGDGNKVTADYDALTEGNVEIEKGYKLRLNVDISKVSKGSKIDVFFGAAEREHSGGGIGLGEADTSFGLPDGDADVLHVKRIGASFDGGKVANGVTITGLDSADNITSGIVPITVPARITASFYGTGDGNAQGSDGQSIEWKDQPVKYWTRATDGTLSAADTTPFGFNISYRQVISGYNENDKKHQTWTDAYLNGYDVNLGMHGNTPVNPPNGTVSLTFRPKNDRQNGDTPWEMTDPSEWLPKVKGAKLIHGATEPELTKEIIDAIDMKVDPVDGGFRVTISNIPKNARVEYEVKNIGLVDAATTAQYRLAPSDYSPAPGTDGFGKANSAANVGGIEGSVEAKREPTAKIFIDGEEWTEENPYNVKPGEEIELTMELGLGGNARITHPVVTNEAGEVVAEDAEISFVPGETEKITFKYTPEKEDSELKFKVTYETGESAEASTWVDPSSCGCTVDYQGEEQPIQDVVDDLTKRLGEAEKEASDLKDKNKELEDQLKEADQAIKDLEQADEDLQGKLDKAETRIGALEGRLNTGLGRCVGTVGGSLLFLLPAVAIASQLLGGLKISAMDEFLAESQKQLGIWDPNLAKAVNDNRHAIAAVFGGLSLLTLALIPGVCGEASLGKAATEQLSSQNGSSKKDA